MGYLPKLLKEILDRKHVVNSEMGKSGNNFGKAAEEYIVALLNSQELIDKYNNDTLILLPEYDDYYFYHVVHKTLVEGHGQLVNIAATREIPRTDAGGTPKTDVSVAYIYEDHHRLVVRYSCKQSTKNVVSGGQHTVEEMFACCNITEPKLKDLWRKFQEVGSGKTFTVDDVAYFSEMMPKYKQVLWRYVLSGGNCDSSDIRIADHLITFNIKNGMVEDFGVHNIDEYYEKYQYRIRKTKSGPIKELRTSGYGTGLCVTRASKSNGKNVQFKIPIK